MDTGKKGNSGVFQVSPEATAPLKLASAALSDLCIEAGVSFVTVVALRSSESGEEDTALSFNIEEGRTTDTVALFHMITQLNPRNVQEIYCKVLQLLHTQKTGENVVEKMRRFMVPR